MRAHPALTYKLARQAMSAIKRFRGHTLRIHNAALECELSQKVGYKMTRARKRFRLEWLGGQKEQEGNTEGRQKEDSV